MNVFVAAAWLALSLLLLVEGLMLTFFPQVWRQTMEKIIDCPNCVLEKISFGMGIGAVLLVAMRYFFLPPNDLIWLAVALALLGEGLFLRFAPLSWWETVLDLSEEDDDVLRRVGKTLLLIASGLALVVVWGR